MLSITTNSTLNKELIVKKIAERLVSELICRRWKLSLNKPIVKLNKRAQISK